MADRKAVLTDAIAKNQHYLANVGGMAYAEKIRRSEAVLAALGAAEAAAAAVEAATEWSGTFDQAWDRFYADLQARQKAAGKDVAVPGSSSGYAFSRQENLDAATRLGVLDELGPDIFGPLVPGASQ
jgi:hypothetical protein